MCVALVVFLSSAVLHSVSAGGAYCAKTARARANALGLEFPGVHGAPDLFGPAHHGMHDSTVPFKPQPHAPAEAESLDETVHAHPRSSKSTSLLSHGSSNPFQSEYAADQVLRPPRGQSFINRKSNFEEVKHVAPSTLAAGAPGQSDLVNRDPQGRSKPLSFVYSRHDLDVDESVPNRRGVSLSGLPRPQSRGHGMYHRGRKGYGLGMEVPVLGSSGSTNKDRIRARARQVAGLKGLRFPGLPAQPLRRGLNVKRFIPVSRSTKHRSGFGRSSRGHAPGCSTAPTAKWRRRTVSDLSFIDETEL